MAAITQGQKAKIHILAKERGLDKETLHSLVYAQTKKSSITQLTFRQAGELIESLSPGDAAAPGMASAKQMKYIRGMIKDLGWVDENGNADDARLQGFVRERFGADDLKWLSRYKASQVIEGLKEMTGREKERKAM